MRSVIVLGLVGACSFEPGAFGSGSGSDGGMTDARGDALTDTMMAGQDAGNCWSVAARR